MIYYNEHGAIIPESEIDLSKGYLVCKSMVHHDAVTRIETKKISENVSLSFDVVDEPAWDEVTEQIFILYDEYDPDNIEQIKANLIAKSKTELATYLSNHPLVWIDGKSYSVTAEKQALLTSQIALYSIAQSTNVPFELTWNTTGDECTVWTYENLCALSLAIGEYVKPFVAKQQEIEIAIKNSKTVDEAYSVKILYN